MRIYIKISFLGLCLGFVILAQSMQRSSGLKNDLELLKKTLNALEEKLKKEIKPAKRDFSLSKFDQEALELLFAEAEKRGIPFHELVMRDLLITIPQLQSGVQPETPVVPGGPPPPPPPAPAVTQLPKGIVVSGVTPQGKEKKPKEGSEPPSLAAILKQRGALAKTGIVLGADVADANQQKKSDEQFLNVFRDSNTIDEIIDQINALTNNPLYLKKESLVEKAKTPLAKGSGSGGLQLTKIGIIALLRRKNQLIFNFFNKNYLKDYLFNPDLFIQEDYDKLKILIQNAIDQREADKAEKEAELEKDYKPWRELLTQVIVKATDLNQVIEFIKAFPSKSKFLPNIIIKVDKGDTFQVAIGSDDLKLLNELEEKLKTDGLEIFVQELTKLVPQEENKLDQLLRNL